MWYSDHRPLVTCLKCHSNSKLCVGELEPYAKYMWTSEGETKFLKYLQNNTSKTKIQQTCTKQYSSVEEATEGLTNLLQESANASLELYSANKRKET